MSNHQGPRVPSGSALAALVGHRLPGGCDDCAAYQTVDELSIGLFALVVHHDDSCPWLAGVTDA